MKRIFFASICCLLVASCATFGKGIDEVSVSGSLPSAREVTFAIDSVNVVLDRFPDAQIATQVGDMLSMKLTNSGLKVKAGKEDGAQLVLLKLEISQRTYVQNVTAMNAVYSSLYAVDGSGKELFRISRYSTSPDSFMSPILQSKTIDVLVSGLQRVVTKGT